MLLVPSIQTILINITNRCNLECKHCYVSSSPTGSIGQNDEVWEKVIDEVVGIYPGVTIAISGGEPLVRMKLVEKLLVRTKGRAKPFILTNGHYFNQRFFASVSEHNPRMRISIDGGNAAVHDYIRGTGSFEKTIAGIGRLREHGYDMDNVEVFCTLQPNKEELLHDVLSLCEKNSIGTIKVEPIAKTGRAENFWPKQEKGKYNDSDHDPFLNFFGQLELENWGIRDSKDMSFSSLTIYENGDVYPFVYYDENDKRTALLGNVQNMNLKDIIDDDKIHHAIVSKIFTAYRGGRRGLSSKILRRKSNEK